MVAIKNYEVYTERMSKTISDKLFFLEHLDLSIDTIVDFGCADGSLGLELAKHSSLHYIGYDIDKTMLDKANNNGIWDTYYNFQELLKNIDTSRSVLVLSSVIHEVYSYGNEYDVKVFWNRVFNSGFKQIAIRDMALIDRKLMDMKPNPKDALIITDYIVNTYNEYIPLNNFADYSQLLLKYWYKENWDRESKENYFPISLDEVIGKVFNSKYRIDFMYNFSIPYVINKIYSDLGIVYSENTHYKLVLTL